ncbi:MAG TPA: hypothetical protein VI757_08450 [Bacteroidia bacterium]|nr:hypothetical protein [Bacteroidia bacterium]
MKKYTIGVFTWLLLFQINETFSQPAISWERAFGGSSPDWVGDATNYYDSPNHCLINTNDGGLIVFGVTSSTDGIVTGNHGIISRIFS